VPAAGLDLVEGGAGDVLRLDLGGELQAHHPSQRVVGQRLLEVVVQVGADGPGLDQRLRRTRNIG